MLHDESAPHSAYLRERHVAAVCERRNDQAAVEAHVLVAVAELPGALANDHVVHLAVPVETQLRPTTDTRQQNKSHIQLRVERQYCQTAADKVVANIAA